MKNRVQLLLWIFLLAALTACALICMDFLNIPSYVLALVGAAACAVILVALIFWRHDGRQ